MQDIVEPGQDRDVSPEAASEFNTSYSQAEVVSVGLDSTYILHLDLSCDSALLGAALSSGGVAVYDADSLVRKHDLQGVAKDGISGLRFSPAQPNVIYTAAAEGEVKLWDLRELSKGQPVRTFSAKPEGFKAKQLLSLDVNCSDNLLAAGTAQERDDSFILFWDTRQEKMQGGYWDSHRDDVTSVSFHPTEPDKLASSGTDGTVNVFNLKESSEDDALQDCVNTESSVQKLVWYGTGESIDSLAILTHTEELLLWQAAEDVGPRKTFTRDDVCAGLRRTSTEHAYLIDAFYSSEAGLSVLGGSSYSQSPCLRLMSVRKEKRFQPLGNLQGPPRTVSETRCGLVRPGVVYTGAEDGCVRRWVSGGGEDVSVKLEEVSVGGKEGKKKKGKKSAPY